MKSFVFRLERVFRLREQIERQRAQALAQAMRDEQQRRDALERAAAQLDRCSAQAAGTEGTIAPAGVLQNLGIAMAAVAQQVEQARVSHREAEASVANETEQFGEARRDRRVVERLRERQQSEWDTAQSRDEQKEIDGVAARRHEPPGGKP